jgi:hypothetical protein
MLSTMSPQVLHCLTSLALPKADARESSAFYVGAGKRTSDYFGIEAENRDLSGYVKIGIAGSANGARLLFHGHSCQLGSIVRRARSRALILKMAVMLSLM